MPKKIRLAIVALALGVTALAVSSAQALSSRTANIVGKGEVAEAFLQRSWTNDWGFDGCNRRSPSRFLCRGFISGEVERYIQEDTCAPATYNETLCTICHNYGADCTFDYTTTETRICDVWVKVRERGYFTSGRKHVSGCKAI